MTCAYNHRWTDKSSRLVKKGGSAGCYRIGLTCMFAGRAVVARTRVDEQAVVSVAGRATCCGWGSLMAAAGALWLKLTDWLACLWTRRRCSAPPRHARPGRPMARTAPRPAPPISALGPARSAPSRGWFMSAVKFFMRLADQRDRLGRGPGRGATLRLDPRRPEPADPRVL